MPGSNENQFQFNSIQFNFNFNLFHFSTEHKYTKYINEMTIDKTKHGILISKYILVINNIKLESIMFSEKMEGPTKKQCL